jgi:two-component system, LuxR family, sensor kinase FixL
MSWVTFTWSMTAGICLTLGAVHFLVWTRRRDEWANLVFSITAAAAAGYAVLDMVALRARSPAEYGELWRWALSLGMLEGVLIAWFIRLHLRAGRLWLLWLICGLRTLMLVLNFVPGPNFYFREITSLQQTPLLGELISRPQGVLHPWTMLMLPSLLLIIIFAIDAAHTAAKRSGRRRPWVLGGVSTVGFTLVIVCYALYARGILPSTFSSQLFLSLILLMGYELSRDVLRAAQLASELRESEQRMALAAEAASLGIWIRDLVKDKIWATDNWRALMGFTKSEPIDLNTLFEKLHPEDREAFSRTLAASAAGAGQYDTEYRVVLPGGRVRWIASRGRVEFNGARKPVLVRGVSVDITERKRVEVEIQQQRNELAHLARVMTLSELSGSLAHELNQPLAIILTNAQAAQRLLAQEPPDLAEARDILVDIVSEDERAGEVIKRLRALLKPGQTSLQSISANALVEDVLRIARTDLIERGIKVHAELDGSLPPVVGDRVQLQQVLLNLILNAGDAMADNPPPGRHLTLATAHRDGTVQVSVSDTGCGLPPEEERVFAPFYTTKKEGLGLGLSICRSIVSAHNGRLWAVANVAATSGGTTFHVELPASEGTSGEGQVNNHRLKGGGIG